MSYPKGYTPPPKPPKPHDGTYPKGYTPPTNEVPKGYTPPPKAREPHDGIYPIGYNPEGIQPTQNNNNVEIKYFEDGNVKSAIIDPWSTTLNNGVGEVLLWRFDHNTKGIFKKKFSEVW